MVLGQGHIEAGRQAVTRSQRLVVELEEFAQDELHPGGMQGAGIRRLRVLRVGPLLIGRTQAAELLPVDLRQPLREDANENGQREERSRDLDQREPLRMVASDAAHDTLRAMDSGTTKTTATGNVRATGSA